MRLPAGAATATQVDAVGPTPMAALNGSLFYASYGGVSSRPTAGGIVKQVAVVTGGAAAGPLAIGTADLFFRAVLFLRSAGDPYQLPVLYRVPTSGGTPVLVSMPSAAATLATIGNVAYWSDAQHIYTPQP